MCIDDYMCQCKAEILFPLLLYQTITMCIIKPILLSKKSRVWNIESLNVGRVCSNFLVLVLIPASKRWPDGIL